MTKKRKRGDRVKMIDSVHQKRMERLPRLAVSSGGESMYEYDMTAHERCGGGRRIIRKSVGGNY